MCQYMNFFSPLTLRAVWALVQVVVWYMISIMSSLHIEAPVSNALSASAISSIACPSVGMSSERIGNDSHSHFLALSFSPFLGSRGNKWSPKFFRRHGGETNALNKRARTHNDEKSDTHYNIQYVIMSLNKRPNHTLITKNHLQFVFFDD